MCVLPSFFDLGITFQEVQLLLEARKENPITQLHSQ